MLPSVGAMNKIRGRRAGVPPRLGDVGPEGIVSKWATSQCAALDFAKSLRSVYAVCVRSSEVLPRRFLWGGWSSFAPLARRAKRGGLFSAASVARLRQARTPGGARLGIGPIQARKG